MRARTLAVTATVAALTATGLTLPLAGSAAAATTARFDFNGDGYTDIAVGMPNATVNGKAKAGYVSVIYGGSESPYQSTGVISQAEAGIPGTPEADDRFGSSVAPVDVNGDGVFELVVGASGESLTSDQFKDEGTITVLDGSEWNVKGTTVARGASEYSSIGRTITTGDYDGDGDTDLVYGENGEEHGALRFRPGPLTADPVTTSTLRRYSMGGATRALATGDFDGDGRDDLATTWQAMDDSGTFITRWDGQAKPAQWWADADRGSALAAADFDRDGTDDLAVGLVQPNPESETTHCQDRLGGALLLLKGSKTAQFGTENECITQSNPEVGGAAEEGDDFGAALSAGDLNGDNRPELVVGVPGEDVGTVKDAGGYVTMNGTEHGPYGGLARSQSTPNMPGTAEAGDRFGAQVAVGDYNRDGLWDTAVSAPGENAGEPRSGGVWFVPSSAEETYPPGKSLTPFGFALPHGAIQYGEVLGL
ncbi:FG-GAP and VCBS repeat-containing protein [Streptomyces europaeiscabiei]|uniref:FG-GAP and VCBS repeat-containing protein n=2 Tax=Streptomyces TaxID=1883 RepID=UPI0029BDEDBD|nr:FG-GAP and VCBS repeat-containing protein [Streptomyces europaeiscabiei]MDX3636130.1 FG-GAP and VCBS repeat-containing protein [Streptomyces europaeiscabiei]MDX3654292.1 FG-GAP and VCBS repeat-containing protein [Streptomyces europaeiscabiei]WUD30093.1 FG-GAP and VCBS repeat-containing protein [Streptomyces europaeiscabiei]